MSLLSAAPSDPASPELDHRVERMGPNPIRLLTICSMQSGLFWSTDLPARPAPPEFFSAGLDLDPTTDSEGFAQPAEGQTDWPAAQRKINSAGRRRQSSRLLLPDSTPGGPQARKHTESI